MYIGQQKRKKKQKVKSEKETNLKYSNVSEEKTISCISFHSDKLFFSIFSFFLNKIFNYHKMIIKYLIEYLKYSWVSSG